MRNVLERTRALGFDPFKGYRRKERNVRDSRVREAIKEIAQLDGAPDFNCEFFLRFIEECDRHIQTKAKKMAELQAMASAPPPAPANMNAAPAPAMGM